MPSPISLLPEINRIHRDPCLPNHIVLWEAIKIVRGQDKCFAANLGIRNLNGTTGKSLGKDGRRLLRTKYSTKYGLFFGWSTTDKKEWSAGFRWIDYLLLNVLDIDYRHVSKKWQYKEHSPRLGDTPKYIPVDSLTNLTWRRYPQFARYLL